MIRKVLRALLCLAAGVTWIAAGSWFIGGCLDSFVSTKGSHSEKTYMDHFEEKALGTDD